MARLTFKLWRIMLSILQRLPEKKQRVSISFRPHKRATRLRSVGIGSDYDGISSTPEGLEDVSMYPALISELYRQGWDKYELAGLTGGNFLRVFAEIENVARELQAEGAPAVYDIYSDEREDMPITSLEI
ncbi:membrane dipeptidase-domain-containing protein [Chiua virens]|nr:membrane dipeptidase-domain-containing protein [Chiua virens]